MSESETQSRLDRISTQWTLLFRAHEEANSVANSARVELLHRYRGAVFRYLVAVVRDIDLAEELSQQFAVQFLQGDFHKANPHKGRFRDYVKAAVINLARRHFRLQANKPGQLPEEFVVPDHAQADDISNDDAEFRRQWRSEVMALTWNALKAARPVYHAVLQFRVNEPELSSRQIAEKYTARFGHPMTAANVRKTLERAHTKFAILLVDEVALSLELPSQATLRRELEELDLLKYCRTAVERWSPAARGR